MASSRQKNHSQQKEKEKKEKAMKKFTYRGKSVEIEMDKTGHKATVTVEGKPFKTMLHTEGKPEDNYIKLWMCEGAYSMFETPEALARHIVEYWYQFSKGEN